MTTTPPRIACRTGLCLATLASVITPSVARAAEEGLEIIPDPRVLLPLLVLFAVLIPVVNAVLVKPLLGVLDSRDQQIRGTRERAARLRADAQVIVERYEDAVAEVRADAEQGRQEQLAAAREEEAMQTRGARDAAEQRLAGARTEIDAALDSARRTLRESIAPLARDAAERVLGRPLT